MNLSSCPSNLRITDLRVTVVQNYPMTSAILQLDTNQGIYGLGELRDYASPTYALMLKRRLLGQNPCDVDRLFRLVKQFGGHGRQGAGVSAIEMALWDLAGKAYGVPAYQLLGGKFRDRIRIYVDTPEAENRELLTEALKERRDAGFTWLKVDLGIGSIHHLPGMVIRPTGLDPVHDTRNLPPPHSNIQLTQRGVEALVEYFAYIRESVGADLPIAIDHCGPMTVESSIRLAQGLEPYSPAWIEDLVPWFYPELWQRITSHVSVPTATGEDIYLKEPFEALCSRHCVSMIHPDLASSGGMLETKKIGDIAYQHGIPMVLHCAGTPVSFLANVHCAAASENFLALEFHSFDVSWWQDLVEGPKKPIISDGFVTVPDVPGLGITLNAAELKKHSPKNVYFEPTTQWDNELSWDRTFS